jgi:hypothetical protein
MSTAPEFHCAWCNKPVDLTTDLNTDENGKTVHESCYVHKISSGEGAGAFTKFHTPIQHGWITIRAG